MRKKIYLFIFVCFFINFNLFSHDGEIESILQNEKIAIGVRINEKSPNLLGIITINDSKISSYGNGRRNIFKWTERRSGKWIFRSKISNKYFITPRSPTILWKASLSFQLENCYYAFILNIV